MSNTNANANPTVPETNGEQPFKLDVRVRPIAPMEICWPTPTSPLGTVLRSTAFGSVPAKRGCM